VPSSRSPTSSGISSDSSSAATPAELRASHADRERAVQELRTAAGDGRLTAEELDDRLEAALTARTLAELDPLVTDLTAAPAAQAEAEAEAEQHISSGSGAAKREGPWVVPRLMHVRVGSGAVLLDFRQALITGPELQIDARVSSGALTLITRPGIAVYTDALTVGSGIVQVFPPEADAQLELRVKISGRVGSGLVSAGPAGHGSRGSVSATRTRRRGWWRTLWRRILGRS